MSLWGSLFTAVKGGANEAAEKAADANAVRILDQQVRDADAALIRAQTDLAGLMGKAKLSRDKVADLEQKYARDMAVVERAVEQGQDALAQELADRIAILEGELERERRSFGELSSKEVPVVMRPRPFTKRFGRYKRSGKSSTGFRLHQGSRF